MGVIVYACAATGTHDIRLVKATEADWNGGDPVPNFVTFYGFKVATAAATATTPASMAEEAAAVVVVSSEQPPPLPTRKIEFLGDSITAGYCNECKTNNTLPGSHGEAFGQSDNSVTPSHPPDNLLEDAEGLLPALLPWKGWVGRSNHQRPLGAVSSLLPSLSADRARSSDDVIAFEGRAWDQQICHTLDAQCHTAAWSGLGMVSLISICSLATCTSA